MVYHLIPGGGEVILVVPCVSLYMQLRKATHLVRLQIFTDIKREHLTDQPLDVLFSKRRQ